MRRGTTRSSWPSCTRRPGDSFLGVGAFFLLIGAVVGGASMVGAEWRAGTFVTLLTWEPNRRRVAVAKLLACGLVATAIAVVLLVAVHRRLPPGDAGARHDRGHGRGVVALAGGRDRADRVPHRVGGDVCAAVAMIGRSTAAALGVAFAYLLVFENLLRAWKPWAGRFLVGRERRDVRERGRPRAPRRFTRSTTTAGLTLLGYVTVTAVARRRRRSGAATSRRSS